MTMLSPEAGAFFDKWGHTIPGPARADLAALLATERQAVWREAALLAEVAGLGTALAGYSSRLATLIASELRKKAKEEPDA
jgi:hypothetical protein